MCLESIRKHTRENYELIIIDNGSTDETISYLRSQPDLIVHENGSNAGFAKGCNQGVQYASGDYIMFLNNDTVVTENWLTNLLRALNADNRIGMVGPVTNYSSGHQQIPVFYSDLSELDAYAKEHCASQDGITVEVRRLVGFCMLTKRSILDEVGGFDEHFGLGNYEDDDMSLRLIRRGYVLKVVHDSFIHHVGHATINQLPDDTLSTLLQRNSQIAAVKWGKNIHQLIYNPPVSVALCMLLHNAESTILQSLNSLTADLNEVIIVDLGSTDRTIDIAKSFTSQIYSLGNYDNMAEAAQYALQHCTSQYVLWLNQGEVLTSEEIKILRGVKISVEGYPSLIPLQFNDGQGKKEADLRYLMSKEAGFQFLSPSTESNTTEE
ncbi:glycosyltransferase [Paenibacillus anaericanus]|uniref:Glycosyltransferase n=2 Tax=Paenibacillus TaxID=44249 RepID=A0A433Y8F8_9BACL|nr:glycosyltransferase [Paenibacillus anaericanus]